jgi:hypothetical protein
MNQCLVHPSKQFWNWLCGMAFRAAVERILHFFVKFGKSGSEIREMLVQVYRDNARKKPAV